MAEGSERVVVPFSRAGARGCVDPPQEAVSGQVPSALPSAPAVTHGDDAGVFTPARPRPSADRLKSAGRAFSSGRHLTTPPASFAEAHRRVHEAAARYDGLLLRWGRLGYGYCWLALKAVTDGLEVATFSPLGLAGLMLTGFLIWLYLAR